ncbi:hypothetical protein LK994_12185 [Ferruginibacter lapsinanis]|uniref:hypothetical protein n=1 Tax=Ferruginibacter lapsinanis TaxID=563172 RepID=UPI001E2FBBDA|nr:hypothetical protein [Ferruginibacter lapsinanis]UEG49391.1 hypothetical protein LK994_12185 [Ferruginibacter lapsinanis]
MNIFTLSLLKKPSIPSWLIYFSKTPRLVILLLTFLLVLLSTKSKAGGTNNTWDGSSSTNWSTAANWSTNLVPVTGTDNIIIPTGLARYPVLTANSACRVIQTMADGSSIGGNFTLTPSANSSIAVTGTATISCILAGTTTYTKTGTGTLILSGANTYSGTTTITAGILALGASNVLPSTQVILNAGTFSTGTSVGYTETVGTLDLNATSTLSLGTGSHTLTFSASDAVAWTAATTLTINGWTGNYTTGVATGGRIYVGTSSSGLTSTQLSQIQFFDGANTYGAIISSSGEILPDPNPPSALSYTTPNVFTKNVAITALDPTVTGYVTSYSVSPSLPTGLSLNTSTGTISGTPTGASQNATNYTVTATNANGSTNFVISIAIGANITSAATGNWNATGTWTGGVVPISADNVTILGAHTVTVNVTNAACASLAVAPAAGGLARLNFSGTTPSLTVTGTVDVGTNSANNNRAGIITFTSDATLTAGAIRLNKQTNGSNSGVVMTAGGQLNTGSISIGTLATGAAFDWTMGTGTVQLTANNTLPATIVTTFNNLKINSGFTTTSGVSFSVGGTLTVDGTLTPGNTAHIFSGAGTLTGAGTIKVNLISATALTSQYTITTKTLTNLTVDYSGAGNQSIAATPINSTNYGSLVTSGGSGTKTLLGAVTVNNDVSIGTGTTLTVSGSNYAINLGRDWSNSGTFTQGSGTVTFNGTTQNILGSTTTFNNLTISSATSTTLGVNTSIAGDLNVTSGILDLATFTANRTAGGGTLTLAAGTTLKIGGTNSFPSNFTTKTLNATSTVNYYGTSQTIAILTYGHLILSTSGTKTLAFSSNTLTVAGNFSLSGSAAATCTGTGATALMAITGNLSLTGTSSLTLPNGTAGTVDVTGTVSIGSGTTFEPGTGSAYTFGNTFTVDGTFQKTTGIGTIDITGLVNVSGTWNVTTATTFTFRGGITNTGSFTAGSGVHRFITNDQALTGNFTIANVSVNTAGKTLTNNNTLTVSTDLSGNGILLQATGSTLNIGGTSTITTLNASTNTNTVNYTAAGSQTVYSTNYSNLGISGGGNNVKTLNGSNTVSGTLTIAASTILAYPATAQILTLSGTGTNTLVSSGTIDMSASNAAHVLQIAATSIASFGSLTNGTGNTVEYTKTTGGQTISPVTFNNLLLDNTSGSNTTGGNITVNGTLTTTSGGSLTNNNILTVTTALSGAGTLVQGASSTLNIGGTSGITGLDASTNTNTVNYTAAGSQTIKSVNYSSLGISGGGGNVKTLSGSNTVSGTLTIAASTVLAYPATAQTLTLSGTGTNTLVSSGTIDMSASNAAHVLKIAATSIASFGSLTNGTGNTVEYTKTAGGQTINSLTYYNLLLDNTSGSNTTGGNITVNGTLTTTSGGSLTNNNILTVTTALSGAGTLVQGASSTLNIGGTSGITGLDASTNTNTVNYTAAGSQTIKSVNYSSLGISGGGGNIKTLNGSNTVSGTLTIAASTVLAYPATPQTLTLSGTGTNTLVNSGTIDMSASNAAHILKIAASSIASFGSLTNGTGNTVEYTVTAGGQTVSAATYNHLLLDNTSGSNTAGGNLVVNGTLTTTAGGTLDMGSTAILSGTLSTIANNGTIKTAVPTATSATPIPTGKTWNGTVEYSAATAQTVVAATSYNNLTITGASVKSLTADNTINSVLTIGSGATLAFPASAQTLTLSGTGTNTLVSSGTIDMSASNAAHVLQIAATSIASFGSLTNGTGSTVEYTKTAGGQTINSLTYNNLLLDNTSGSNTTGGNITVNGTLTTTSGGSLTNNNILTVTTALSGAGTLVQGASSTLNIGGTSGITGLDASTNTNTVNYTAAGSQTIKSVNYSSLGISGGGGNVKTLSGSNTVSGTLTIAASTVLAYPATAQTLTLSGTGTNTLVSSGTIDMSASNAAHVLQIAATSIASFGSLTNGTGNTVEYTKTAGGQTVNAATYNHLLLDNTSGSNTAGGNLVVNGTLTTTAGGTLDMGSTAILSGTLSTIANNGTIKTAVPTATSATPIPTGKTWDGTVEYAAASAQTVVAATSYNNLVISGAGAKSLTTNITTNSDLTIAAGTLDIDAYTIDRATAGGTLTVANGGTLKIGGTNTIPANYSTHVIGSSSTIEFAGGNQSIVTLNSSQPYGNLTLSGSGTKTLSANTLVAGNWTRNSGPAFNHNNKSVSFVGASKSIITAPASSVRDINGARGGETFYDIYMSKTNTSDSLRLSSNITVENEIGFVKGAFNCGVGDVTIVSNVSKTARVAPIGNISNVSVNYSDTGKFIIQRFLPINPWSDARRWRLLTAPVSSSSTNDITISRAWQEGAKNTTLSTPVDPQPGFGTTITNGNTGAAVANGFDLGNTASPSMYYMSPGLSPAWVAPTNTNATNISAHEGYMVFVRGHRGVTISNQFATPDKTTLEPKGRIIIGDTTKSIVAGVQVIGNPYASAINFNNMLYNGVAPNTPAGLGLTYYLWDPKSPGAYNVGQWITFSSNGNGTYSITPTPVSSFSDTGLIESGAAFVINSPSAGTLVIHESDKVGSSSTVGIASRPIARPLATPIPKMAVNMYLDNGDGTKSIMDGVSVLYSDSYRDIVDIQDAVKISTFTSRERVGIVKPGTMLSIERRKTQDTIFLSLNRINTAGHQLEFISTLTDLTTEAFLEDKYLQTTTKLTANATTLYNFSTTADAASSDTSRFRILFRPIVPLPVKFSSVKASQQNENIAVEWKVENETNVKSYQIERSADGVHFNKVNTTTVNANNAGVYNWFDLSPVNGNNYYRIRIEDQAGATTYSQIVKVTLGNKENSITVLTNPIENNIISLQFNNQIAGVYKIRLYNLTGQMIDSKTVAGSGASWNESFLLNTNLSKGVYNLEINTPANEKVVQKILVR